MKLLVALLLCALNADALRVGAPLAAPVAHRLSPRITASADGAPINKAIDKESPKVVTQLAADDIDGKAVMCRCWRSATFPYCDAAHVKHNKETGDNVGPLIVSK